ncbi:ScbA/BarX family gamma-butyrolactone biosynthesis protein [Streptomyces sp. NPDC050759]|uniref:ScbA/BarX family gamma-butyrolactone biosynthesis protein n=1 Tax=Streptomyces sp. NPDC050759 TaxID=3365635 RepID=UPI0037B14887
MPRASVHKSATAEVLLTDAVHLGDDRFAVAAVWHRDHFLGHHGAPASDPVLLAETARQAAIHLSHRFHDIPEDRPFVLDEVAVELDEALPPADAEPLALGLDIRCRRTAGPSRRTGLELDAVVRTAHRRPGRARVRWEVIEPRRYAVLRKRGAPEPGTPGEPEPAATVPVPAHLVGGRQEHDVLLAADPARPDRWWLRLDLGHPVLFDHPSDHIPGMALVEAFRQAVLVTVGDGHRADGSEAARQVRILITRFTSFGELNLPVSITVESAGGDHGAGPETAFTLRAVQGERELASARVVCATPHSGRRPEGAAC